nr:DNA translocase FtsK [Ktedonobacterales bacterium]
GKSVCLSAIIGSLISHATPDEVRLLLIDPKMVELTLYAGIPHLLAPVITDPAQAGAALAATLDEMTRRYALFHQHGVRHIAGYDALRARPEGGPLEKLPRIVVVIDELADLMMQARDEIEEYICRLAQLARATGIHLVVATQRPSVDVITGLIKANIATRIAFMVSSGTDARTIMDGNGAEQLLGKGDMLFQSDAAPKPERIQGAYVGDDEIARLADFWSNQATKLGMVPAQWDLADAEGDAEEDVLAELRRRTRGASPHTRKR